MVSQIAIAGIRLYQKTLSPDHGWFQKKYPAGYCRFSPTCSEYCIQALRKYGMVRGGWLGVKRIIRCNPWSKGGVDKIPISKY